MWKSRFGNRSPVRVTRVRGLLGGLGRWTLVVVVLCLALIGFLHLTRGTAVRHVRGVATDGVPIGVSEPQFPLVVTMISKPFTLSRGAFTLKGRAMEKSPQVACPLAQVLLMPVVSGPCFAETRMAYPLPLQVLDGADGQRRQTPDRLSETINPSERAAVIMATTAKFTAATNGSRDHELRRTLEERRRELVCEVRGKIRDGHRDYTKEREVLDEGESSEVDIQEEIEFALIEMKAETLKKIDAALRRIGQGTYGECLDCGEGIPAARLRSLPFAVRCKDCEEAREAAELRERMTQRRGSSALFVNMVN